MNTKGPDQQDNDHAEMLGLAARNLTRVLAALDEVIGEIETRQDGAQGKAKALAADLRKAIQTVFDERQRIDKLDGKLGDTSGGGAGLDLDAARAEIGRRLDRLRERGGADGVSGGADG
ncbi:hypothetical protein [Sinisalibacter aestuarii]|uniref:Permease n=1 Tax=Sinisalibacter aestuarii TaxID=2949426 RepID=A0ABQ5LVB1_9RHOB|nr:hypothetical protein [Sinisalibacter aestuarii]GKY88723.1 hypothetical protein STA1M1_25920 [Sinisalibacter aestuarii]